MSVDLRKLAVLVVLALVLGLGVGVLAYSYTDIGSTDELWRGVLPLSSYDLSFVSQSVADDAGRVAVGMFGDSQKRYETFVDQLLAEYVQARDKDVIVLFNSGGWGVSSAENSPGWRSILTGIQVDLDKLGYTSLLLNYRRTSDTLWGCAHEFVEGLTSYPDKAEALAQRVDFLTKHISNLKVIVAGESNGSVISDVVMNLLRENPRVYSIQTGPPFWYNQKMADRTLVLKNNGMGPDAFSQGNLPSMIWASLMNLLGFSSPNDNPGKVLRFLNAPGHDYSWRYPEVYSEITEFLVENFGSK